MKGYVINLDRQPERLTHFYKQSGSEIFERVPAVDRKVLELIGEKEVFFDTSTFSQFVSREIAMGEIACTLSHIRCWRKIATDEKIQEHDFVLIAEDDVILLPENSNASSFLKAVKDITHALKDTPIELVKLQSIFYQKNDLFTGSHNITLKTIKGEATYDSSGSSLYLIRKRLVKNIINRLQTIKPYWLADDFSHFCAQHQIVGSSPMLGYVRGDFPSDLEIERQKEREINPNNISN